jgi:hypothetical protein
MIGKQPQGKDGGKRLYVALMFLRQLNQWRALEGEHKTALDAGRACLAAFLPEWREINENARILRVMCEHPKFDDFYTDGIDAGMIRRAARNLSKSIELQNDNIERLLDAPGNEDLVALGNGLYELDPDSQELEPFKLAAMVRRHEDPDIMLAVGVSELLAAIQDVTGKAVTAQGYTDAVIELLLMHPNNEEGDTDAEQPIVDSLFRHCMATAASRVIGMVGSVPRLHPKELESSVPEALAMVRPRLRKSDTAEFTGQGAKVIAFQKPTDGGADEPGGDTDSTDKDGGDDNGGDA